MSNNTIRPSVRLKVISVSKLSCLKCLRYYFWKHILNLESNRLNTNFWYGGVLGAGFESLLLGKTDKQVLSAMDKESDKRTAGYELADDTLNEISLQRRLIDLIVLNSRNQPKVKDMHMAHSQIEFRLPLECGVLFCGTEDGEGTYRNKECLFENKTASKVNSSYIDSRRFTKQVNGYAYACRKQKRSSVPECRYSIFCKTQKYVKKNQTVDEFIEEIHQDIANRPEKYYIWHSFSLGRSTVSSVGADIERQAHILKLLYADCGGKLLDPALWPKQENKCYDYAGCEYLQLCKNPRRWELYLRFFKQREMLYSEEQEELE